MGLGYVVAYIGMTCGRVLNPAAYFFNDVLVEPRMGWSAAPPRNVDDDPRQETE
jgi:hypothetical protein